MKSPVKWIKAGLLRPNPFNPKREFNSKESSLLKESLLKHGLKGVLTVIPYDWKEPGTFVIIEGNSRHKLFKEDDKVQCYVWEDGAKTDAELEILTLDFAIYKKANQTKKFEIYSKYRLKMSDAMKTLFEEVSTHGMTATKTIAQAWTGKTLLIQFENEESFLRFKHYAGNLVKVIKDNSKLYKELEKRTTDITMYTERYFFDIIFIK